MGKIDFDLVSRCPTKAARRQAFSREVGENRKDQKVSGMRFSAHPLQFPMEYAASQSLVGCGSPDWQRGSQADYLKRPAMEAQEENFRAADWIRGSRIVNEHWSEGALETLHPQEDRREARNRLGDSFGDY